ncbi:DNA (cytosine-5-)-methyltransferase [bacterium]|nr:DNA (cytosine-5-)-methyltransferase [bacterium]
MEKIKVIELFSGLGAQRRGLELAGIDHEIVAISEIDKYAIKCYNAIHGEGTINLGDIKKIEVLPKADLWTYSFPCTNISICGKREGFEKNSGTQSSLLWEVSRLLSNGNKEGKLPKYLLLENVKAIINKKNKKTFDEWCNFLEMLGYKNFYDVLNAKDYGIPQNRDRLFMVSIRKDIDHNMFEFPKPYSLEKRLKDFLEPQVDEKYYLSDKMISCLMGANQSKSKYPRRKIFMDSLKMPNEKGIAKTITTKSGNRPTDNFIIEHDINHIIKIRKLTPLECFRIMGFNVVDYIKC